MTHQNRTMEQAELLPGGCLYEARTCIEETAVWAAAHGAQWSSWVGTITDEHRPSTELNKGPDYKPLPDWPYDADIPWFTLWEYCWCLDNVRTLYENWRGPGMALLSLGGNACLLDLAFLRLGHSVHLVEQRQPSVTQQFENAEKLGVADRFHASVGRFEDVLPLDHAHLCDCMVSTNVIFLSGERGQRAIADHLHRWITPGGYAVSTFDFLNPNPDRFVDDPIAHFAWRGFKPSGKFHDTGSRHHLYFPDPTRGFYTAGGLVQTRL